MAFKLKRGPSAFVTYPTSSTTCAPGDVLDLSSNAVTRATSSSTVLTIECVAQETLAGTSVGVKAIPILPGAVQLWEADSTNNTASNQLMEDMVLTDHDTVNNTGTTSAAKEGIFRAIAVVGAAGDKKLLGYFHKPGQVVS